MGVILDAGTCRAAKFEPVAIFVRTPKTDIFVGLVDMKSAVENETEEGDDADKANAEAYFTALKDAFGNVDIPWDIVEPKIKAPISDGASIMSALLDLLNRKCRCDPILLGLEYCAFIDALHCNSQKWLQGLV